MLNMDVLAAKANAILLERAGQHFEVLLNERGVQDPGELPRPVQQQLLESAILAAAASLSPTEDLEAQKHWFRAIKHPAFLDAMDRMTLSCKLPGDAFDVVRGIYAAVVLAGWGLPVAPFDFKTRRVKATPSNDIDTVREMFSGDKCAFVGYSTCDAPFYLLLTDCISTLRQLIPVHPMLAEVRHLFARGNTTLPPEPGQPFTHGIAFGTREIGDTFSTVWLREPDRGSITFYAGWRADGNPRGAPNGGYTIVPTQLLRAVVNDPRVAWWFWREQRIPPSMH